jgi:poly-gamma-glutamate capsule biosynthesis protein CapA/YwtB (metallophosphatase superfamily)
MDWLRRVFISFIMFTACISLFMLNHLHVKDKPIPTKAIKPPQQKRTEIQSQIVLTAVGDVLLHDRVYNDARIDVEHFDFHPMFSAIKPYIEKTDIAFANQESIIGGVEIGLSTYPSFNSPIEIADALKDTGFDVVNMANNHALDRGEQPLKASIAYWDNLGLVRTGAYVSAEDRSRIRTISKNGITLSVLSYTYGTNGIKLPKPYLVNLIDREAMKRDVEAAKQISDAVVVNLHFGKEYEIMPNNEQKELAQFLSDLGVSVIFGHHPHVLQPPAFIYGINGNSTFVFYSLGNFLAGQQNEETWFGGITNITVVKNKEGKIELKSPSFLPTFTYSKNSHDYKVLPLDQVTEQQYKSAQQRYKSLIKHMKTFIPDLYIIQTKNN